jgi:uncharacterized surface protein with fasciclin (FAS1) repeats
MNKVLYRKILLLSLIVPLALGLYSCKEDNGVQVAPTRTMMELIEADANFSILNHALTKVGMDRLLRGAGTYTLFAPNNAAFAAFGINSTADVDALPNGALTRILRYHMLGFRAPSGFFNVTNATVNIAAFDETGAGIAVNSFPQRLYITTVPTLADTPPFNSIDVDGSPIVFAYIGALRGISINGIAPVRPDIAASNGVIHEVGRVVVPPAQNLLATIQNDPRFTLFEALRQRANILAGSGNLALPNGNNTGALTVFAPTNDAFAAAGIDAAAIAALPVAEAVYIYRQHIGVVQYNFVGVAGPANNRAFRSRTLFPSSILGDGSQVPTIINRPIAGTNPDPAGRPIKVSVVNGEIILNNAALTPAFNGARVIESDIVHTNGILHVIDKVLNVPL